MSLKPFEMHAEEFSATGNITSEGMRNQLGRPRLDRLTVLVREAVQNSWDARRDRRQVKVALDLKTLDVDQVKYMADLIFAELPPDAAVQRGKASTLAAQVQLAHALQSGLQQGLLTLTISDYGTSGLGGPTRANVKTAETKDFVDFFRNVGQPPDKIEGGGTFGYGKAALYLASSVHTIIVHTIGMYRGAARTRLMASALTNCYEDEESLYTGRHWWGDRGRDRIVGPATGGRAERIAAALGFPRRAEDELGTSIMILSPLIDGRSTEQAMNYLVVQLLFNFWPKMVAWENERHPRMKFEARLEGRRVPISKPEDFPPLHGFVRSLRDIRRHEAGAEANSVQVVTCLRPRQELGRLSLTRIAQRRRKLDAVGSDATLPDLVDRCHHVALLRRPELVVDYRPGPILPLDGVEYAGVFLANTDTDRIFAASEPPTHDTWRYQNLSDKHQRTFVRVALQRIDNAAREFVAPTSSKHSGEANDPLGHVARELGHLLITTDSNFPVRSTHSAGPSGGGKPTGDKPVTEGNTRGAQGGRSRSKRPRVVADQGLIATRNAQVVCEFGIDLQHAKGTKCTRLSANAYSVLAGGDIEREVPEGCAAPEVLCWISPSGTTHDGQETIASEEGRWTLVVSVPGDALVGADVTGAAE